MIGQAFLALWVCQVAIVSGLGDFPVCPFRYTPEACIEHNNNRVIEPTTLMDCAAACLDETSFTCRSFEWKVGPQKCHLSKKGSKSAAFYAVCPYEEGGTHYFERICFDDDCADCSITCENGGTLDADACTCDCPAPFTGDTCGDCSITSCNNGGTLDSAACTCTCLFPYTGETCDVPPVTASITCDDIVLGVFADGVALSTNDGNANQWNQAADYLIPDDTVLFQVQCENTGGPAGFLASFSNGVETDAAWECSTTDFDTDMAPANVYDPNGSSVAGISSTASWIWTSNNKFAGGSGDVINYCQVTI